MSKSRLKDSIPFHVFVRRAQVLSLYRQFQRSIGHVEDQTLKKDIKSQVYSQFRANRSTTDNVVVRYLIQDAKRQLIQLQAITNQDKTCIENSWINTKDADDERGRVGTGWPWKSVY